MNLNALKDLANTGCNISVDTQITPNGLRELADIIKEQQTHLTVHADHFALGELKSVAELLGKHFTVKE